MSTPFFFGPADRALLGHLHVPTGETEASLGVVICNPFGFEEVSAHRSLRYLGSSLAQSGIPALRFDYWGCGNSAGEDVCAAQLRLWIDAIAEAITALKAKAGVEKVVLVGLRLGALLASLAANEQSTVVGIVAIAPAVQGRRYVREMRALAQASTTLSPADAPEDGSLEVTGFSMAAQTMAALEAIDLLTTPLQNAPRVLIVERDDLPSNGKWLAALTAQGIAATSQVLPGYVGMMEDPQRVTVPTEMWAAVTAEVNAWRAQVATGAMSRLVSAPASGAYTTGAFTERCVAIPVEADSKIGFGRAGDTLFGVLTVPAKQSCARAVICLNSGAVHLMGPNRLWVRIARDWAARGVAVLRMDFSGIGDSPARQGCAENIVYSVPALAEVEQAVQYVRNQLNVQEVHLLGLCSGAYHAFKSMAGGVPVQSGMIINPLTYFWEPGKVADDGIKDYEIILHSEKYSRQLFTLAPWKRLLRGELDIAYLLQFVRRKVGVLFRGLLNKTLRKLYLQIDNDLNHELISAARGAGRQHFIFAHGDPGCVLLQQGGGRSLAALSKKGMLEISMVENADHTFTRASARDQLVKILNMRMFRET